MAQLKKDDYKEQGSSQLLPFDLRLLANRLLSASCIIALQTWVIILLAVKLFLRHDEFHDIDMSQFVAGMVEIKEHRVDVLVLEVFGKADKTWVTLKIYADHDYLPRAPPSDLPASDWNQVWLPLPVGRRTRESSCRWTFQDDCKVRDFYEMLKESLRRSLAL